MVWSRTQEIALIVFLVASFGISQIAISGIGLGNRVREPSATENDPHDPIHVTSDRDLMTPDAVSGNGVRRGSGTEEDPYVIERWEISFDATQPAIWIEETTSHVLIQNISFEPTERSNAATYVWIRLASHVRIQDLQLKGFDGNTVILVNNAQDIAVAGVTVGGDGYIQARNSGVEFTELEMRGNETGVSLIGGSYEMTRSEITIPGSTGSTSSTPAVNLEVGGDDGEDGEGPCRLRIRRTVIRNDRSAGLWPSNPACRVVVSDSRFLGLGGGIQTSKGAHITARDVTIDGASFDGSPGVAPYGVKATSDAVAEVSNVSIADVSSAIAVENGGLKVSGSRLFSYETGIAVRGACDPCTVRETDLLGRDGKHAINNGPSTLDARHNWWGSPDGPPDDMIEGDVLVEPWKTEGPDPPDRGSATPLPGLLAAAALAVAAALVRRRS